MTTATTTATATAAVNNTRTVWQEARRCARALARHHALIQDAAPQQLIDCEAQSISSAWRALVETVGQESAGRVIYAAWFEAV